MDILDRQVALQVEADAAVVDLELAAELASFGEPVRVGSSAMGLMSKPDVDLTVICPKLDGGVAQAVAQLGARLACHERVRQVTLRNDTGVWNSEPEFYPDGLYLGIRYRSPSARDWNFDVWFIDEPDRQPDLEHLRSLVPRLTDEARVAILRIKEAWSARPEYGSTVRGVDIYQAVLDDRVLSVSQFEEWLARRALRMGRMSRSLFT